MRSTYSSNGNAVGSERSQSSPGLRANQTKDQKTNLPIVSELFFLVQWKVDTSHVHCENDSSEFLL